MFGVLQAKSWHDATQIAESLPDWVFRGQGDARWPLETTLYRSALQLHYPSQHLFMAEDWMLREFRRRAHHYVADLPAHDDKLEWLALIQHFGGPTRLLDFTYSFYVAAFFAMERTGSEAAIWAIDRLELSQVIAEKTGAQMDHESMADSNRRHVAAFLNSGRRAPIVANVEPERLNERLSIQQGLFLLPCDLDVPFASVLEQTFDWPAGYLAGECEAIPWQIGMAGQVAHEFSVVKILLPRAMHGTALQDLQRMNMNSATLFPGLDGFARSLYFHLRTFEIAGPA